MQAIQQVTRQVNQAFKVSIVTRNPHDVVAFGQYVNPIVTIRAHTDLSENYTELSTGQPESALCRVQ